MAGEGSEVCVVWDVWMGESEFRARERREVWWEKKRMD